MLALLCPLGAQGSQYLCRYIGIDRGLSNSNATSVTRDARGFLWIGTRYGLNRYDFNQTDNYYHKPGDARSLPDNNVRLVFSDSHRRLWVATENGLVTYDDKTDDFTPITCNGKAVSIRSMAETPEGMLMGGRGSLYFCRHNSDKAVAVSTRGGSRMFYTDIHPWYTGTFVLATRWDGLWKYDRARGTIERLPGVPETDIMCSSVDPQGNLWISPYSQGFFCYRPDGSRTPMVTRANSALSSDRILDLLPDRGQLWIATDGGGVCVYDPIAQQFVTTTLAANKAVTALYADRYDNIYGATVRDGAMSIREVAMRAYNRLTAPDIRISAILSICRDVSGTVWLGDDGNGVLRVNADNSLTNLPSTYGMKVTGLAPMGPGRLLVSTFDNGFHVLGTDGSLSAAPAPLQAVAREALSVAVPLHLCTIDRERIAVVCKKVYVYNHASGQLAALPGPADVAMVPFYCDGKQLMCRAAHRIVSFSLGANGHARVLDQLPAGQPLLCANYDGKGTLYVGSHNRLRIINLDARAQSKDRRRNVTELSLPGIQRIGTVMADGDRLWLGANGSVYLYDRAAKRMLRFGEYDGAAPNEFLPQATLATEDGLFLGGVNGLLRIANGEIDRIVSAETAPIINVADLTVDGQSVYRQIENGRITLPHWHSSVALRVVADANHYLQRQPVRYHLRCGGDERIIETSDNLLPLNGLEPGKDYELLWSCALSNGSWTEPQQLLSMAVAIPWYNSIWTRLLVLLLAGGILTTYEIRRRKTHRLRMERRIDEMKHKSMEREIAFLVDTNQALRTPMTMIYAPIKQVLEQARNNPAAIDVQTLELVYANTKKMRDAMDEALELHRVSYNHKQQIEPGDNVPESAAGQTDTAPSEQVASAPSATDGSAAAPATVADGNDVTDLSLIDMSRLDAMIVEEDRDLCTFLASALTPYFRSVVNTFDGSEALQLIQRRAPDIIIASQSLPGINGLDLCRKIKQSPDTAHIPVIMLTAFRDDPERARGYSAGADSHLSKPFDLAVLLARCRNLLHTRAIIRRRYESAEPAQGRQEMSTAYENFMRRVDRVIADHIEEGVLGIDTLMTHLHMSRSALYGRFKEITNDTPGNYITAWRLRKAKELLTDPALSVSEIADRLGFATQRYFSTFFKDHTGQSPRDWRQSQ